MDIRFDGKIAVVTGAGSGIGYACAEYLIKSGASVAMIGRTKEKIQQAALMLKPYGQAHPYCVDVTDTACIHDAISTIRADLGEIKYLIQCAGRPFRLGREHAMEGWQKSIALNATASYSVMMEVVEQSMLPAGKGAIVHIASMAGIRGIMPPMSDFGYSAGKGALVSLSQQAAVMWGKQGIRVNTVAPGGVTSGGIGVSDKPSKEPDDPSLPYLDVIPTGRHSTPYEVAALACFLLSDYSGNITGQVIAVDGGATALGF